jgi:adhesin/invasin
MRFLVLVLLLMSACIAIQISGCSEGQLYSTDTSTSALTADPPTLEADGFSSSRITATMTDPSGQPVPAGTPVNFFTDLGRFSNGLQSITVETTSDTGIVVVSLIAGNETGTAEVRAESLGVTQAIRIPFVVPGTVTQTASITLSTDDADTVGRRRITAILLDKDGNPVAIGTEVVFQTDWGHFGNNESTVRVVTTDESGTVTVTLFQAEDGSDPGAAVTVKATSGLITATLIIPVDVVEEEATPTPTPSPTP